MDGATAKGETPLMFSAYRNLPQVMGLLLDCGASARAVNHNGDGALALAAGCGNAPDCVRLLLSAGVSCNVRDGAGHTPLMLAVGQGNATCAEVLLATGQVRALEGNYY